MNIFLSLKFYTSMKDYFMTMILVKRIALRPNENYEFLARICPNEKYEFLALCPNEKYEFLAQCPNEKYEFLALFLN